MWPLRQNPAEAARPAPFHGVEENLRSMMQFFSRARNNGEVTQRECVQLVSSGIDFSPFNSAMLAEPLLSEDIREFESCVSIAAEYFRQRRERWSFWLCDEMLPPALRRKAKSILMSRHMRQTSEPPGMIAETILPSKRTLPEDLGVLEVRDAKSRADFSGVTACTFDLPFSICREIYQSESSWTEGPMRGWVGYVGAEPIATCATVVTGEVIGVYTVSTMPAFRRRGYSELLMRYVLSEMMRETGLRTTILQATPAGYPMYHKMGFRSVCNFSIFLSEH